MTADEGKAYYGSLHWLCGAWQPVEEGDEPYRCNLRADHGNMHEVWGYGRLLASWPRLGAKEEDS